jgi:predicted DNA-binding protein with PD1-like motif
MHLIEQGHTGRIFYLRIHPNEDLVQSLEKAFMDAGLTRALVRGGLGSLAHGCVAVGPDKREDMPGPAVEILHLSGEISSEAGQNPQALLTGAVLDTFGAIHAGEFVTGRNPACMTIEVVMEEWVVEQSFEY